MANEVAVKQSEVVVGFNSAQGFELLQRQAKMFNSSTLVPPQYQGEQNFGNAVIALEMASRMNASPLMVMQNLYIVYGNPGWSSKFLISMFNQCGRFSAIKYKETGVRGTDSQGIVAYTTELATGEIILGPEVTISIAKQEGWYDKKGSKWKTMPDQMLRYRAAAWLIRTTAPELSMGLQTADEVIDVQGKVHDELITNVAQTIENNANTEVLDIPQEKHTFVDVETGEVIDDAALFGD
ncbi:hypothetical protein [Veillonella caviae]|uniref:hypothetical protein n=1 Tax=Veillonella caviae TaxID=248316 RepID=UPI000F8D9D0A|nr:hypothetical protein [Veillonella caviae]